MGSTSGLDRRPVGFARWRSDLPSGGNRYDDELAARLGGFGIQVRQYPVAGPWPLAAEADRQQLAGLLTAEQHWLVGNIVAAAAPEVIAAAVADGRQITMLMHYFPADDPALATSDRNRLAATEAAAVRAASAIIVPSTWAAAQVALRYHRVDAVVAVPGVEPAPPAVGSWPRGAPPMLLWLGRLSRLKDPLTFARALARLGDLDWTARFVGPDTDEAVTRAVRGCIEEAGLGGRIEMPGSQHSAALEATWAQTDLLVHTSQAETYGMVVSEALARGIPSIVPDGTGAVEAQAVGVSFPPTDVTALTTALRGWLASPRLRQQWRDRALEQRTRVPTWQQTAAIIASVLTG
ncbi:MAG: glycosyltransferase family 4 protein [Brooklawnia sp.]|jgi:glycosyltransferase involved in cell wall biosynthesis